MSRSHRQYSAEFVRESVSYALKAVSISFASKELGIPEATLHGRIKKAKLSGESIEVSGEVMDVSQMARELRELRKQVSRLEQEKAILKKGGHILCQGARVKYEFIKSRCHKYSIATMCKLFSVSRSGYYAWLHWPL